MKNGQRMTVEESTIRNWVKGIYLLQASKKGVRNGVAHDGVPILLLKRYLFSKNAVWMRKFNITFSLFYQYESARTMQ